MVTMKLVIIRQNRDFFLGFKPEDFSRTPESLFISKTVTSEAFSNVCQ